MTNRKGYAPVESFYGTVVKVMTPRLGKNDRYSPFKFVIETDQGDQDVSVWAEKDKDGRISQPIRYGPTVHLDIADAIGTYVEVIASPGEPFNNRPQWENTQSIKPVENTTISHPTEPTSHAPTPSASPPSVDLNQRRIMLQHASATVTNAYNGYQQLDPETRGTFSNYLKAIAEASTWYLSNVYIPGGYVKPEPEPVSSGVNVVEQDDLLAHLDLSIEPEEENSAD